MRIIARFAKTNDIKLVSHLDIQRLFGRAFRRANVPVAYSQGFNPHPVLSFATALTLGISSDGEWLDVKLAKEMDAEDFIGVMNTALPIGFRIIEAAVVDDGFASLSASMKAASYSAKVFGIKADTIQNAVNELLAGEIMVTKRSKSGMKTVDIRNQVYDVSVSDGSDHVTVNILGELTAGGSLNADVFLQKLKEKCADDFDYQIHKEGTIFSNDSHQPW